MLVASAIEWIFWLALFGVSATYLIYPLLMIAFDRHSETLQPSSFFPEITVVFAAYNEASVIREKILSTLNTNYPSTAIKILIGTDACTDETDKIISELKKEFQQITHIAFTQRTGKPGILNALIPLVDTPFIVCTDANVLFTSNTLNALMAPFEDNSVGMVAGNITYGQGENGIANQERSYLKLENRLKLAESNRFGSAIGAEGGCYAIRTELFPTLPPLVIVDDFYISMHVLKQDFKLLFEPNAIGQEDVSSEATVEYRRKKRISTGNWQNLEHFGEVVLTDFFPLGALFFFHKILRWFTPFLLTTALICAYLLLSTSLFYGIFAAGLSSLLILIFVEKVIGLTVSKSANWAYLSHFIWMNIALMDGFFSYVSGVKTNIWQRTKRNER